MATTALGRLTRIELKTAWKTEDGDLTPCLATEENLELLSEAIGLDFELETTEKDVGPFRADLFYKDTTSGHSVLIENQIGRTDHTRTVLARR